MDSDQALLDAHDAYENDREAAEKKLRETALLRLENAAKQAHLYRMTLRLVSSHPVNPDWENLSGISHSHLIADAKHVDENPSITADELNQLYKERLIAWGDTDSPDLGIGDESTPTCQDIEGGVLEQLKKYLDDSKPRLTPF